MSGNFQVGQIIHHRLFDYRGVIVECDEVFLGSDDWYEHVAHSRPPKDRPWYHVLVHGSDHTTYVSERNLEPDPSARPVSNPLVGLHFDEFRNGRYSVSGPPN
jgi:heat shock protein HspQ